MSEHIRLLRDFELQGVTHKAGDILAYDRESERFYHILFGFNAWADILKEDAEKCGKSGKPIKTFIVEVSGNEAILKMGNLFKLLGTLGSWGCSRHVTIDWDGDGDNKLSLVEPKDLQPKFTRDDLQEATNYDLIYCGSDGIEGRRQPKPPRAQRESKGDEPLIDPY